MHTICKGFFLLLQHSPSIAFPCTASIGIIDSGLSGQSRPWKQTPCARCQSGLRAPGLSRSPHLVSTCPWERIMRRPWRAHTSIWKTSSQPFVTGNSLQRSVFIKSYLEEKLQLLLTLCLLQQKSHSSLIRHIYGLKGILHNTANKQTTVQHLSCWTVNAIGLHASE